MRTDSANCPYTNLSKCKAELNGAFGGGSANQGLAALSRHAPCVTKAGARARTNLDAHAGAAEEPCNATDVVAPLPHRVADTGRLLQ